MRSLEKGRTFTAPGIGRGDLSAIIEGCLDRAGFTGVTAAGPSGRSVIVATQRASWARILLSSLPQRVDFELRPEPGGNGTLLRYNERYFGWYLVFLLVLAGLFGQRWIELVTAFLRLASAPDIPQEFSVLSIWVTGACMFIFCRAFLASGAGTVSLVFEDLREKLRGYGTLLDQSAAGSLTTKALITYLFCIYMLLVSMLAVLPFCAHFIGVLRGGSRGTIVLFFVIFAICAIGLLLVKGVTAAVRPAGGEERFAAVATGMSTLIGVMCILAGQLSFLLLGLTTDEFWVLLLHAQRELASTADLIILLEGKLVARERVELGLTFARVLANFLLAMVVAVWTVGAELLIRSITTAPIILTMCRRIHVDIETNYARSAASGAGFLGRFRSAFLAAWILSALLIGVGLVVLAGLGASCLIFGYPERLPTDPTGPVDATANVINFLAGLGQASWVGPSLSRLLFVGWTAAVLLPVALVLLGFLRSRIRNGRRLARLSASSTPGVELLEAAITRFNERVGLSVELAVSQDEQPVAAAHATGMLTRRRFVEVSKRCLDILDRDELEALVAHEMAHHLCGHCTKHNLMQWLGRWTYVGGTFVGALEDSFGFELEADRAAIAKLGVGPGVMKTCLMKMRADAVVQQLQVRAGGISLVAMNDRAGRPTSEMRRWKTRFQAWVELYTADAAVAYWHPSIGERIKALETPDSEPGSNRARGA